MSDLVKKEPVLASSAATSVVAYLLSQLVTHGVITDTQTSSATQATVGFVAAALPIVAGVLMRRLVTPARKVADVLEREGLLTDADFARLEGVLADALGVEVDLDGSDDAVELTARPTDGMSAGADPDVYVPEHAPPTTTEGA